jgi:hypothetical protein
MSLSMAVAVTGLANVAEGLNKAHCWIGVVLDWKYSFPMIPVASFVRGIPLLNVAVAEVSELTVTESAKIEANMNLGVDPELAEVKPEPVREIVLPDELTAETVNNVSEV